MRKKTRSQPRNESLGVKNYPPPRQTFLPGESIEWCPTSTRLRSIRKRAKTEDEKEQRRIERVLRNRQAAQSSRERKRQEVEKLEGEKHAIEQQNQLLKERLMAVEHEKFKLAQQVAKMTAEMSAFKSQGRPRALMADSTATSCAPSPSLGADLHQQAVKQEFDDYPFALPTPQNSIDPSTSCFSTPSSSTYSRSPSPSHVGLGLDAITSSDMTQHPAAMLCGLQCLSEEAWLASTPPTRDEARRFQQAISSQLCLTLILAVYSHLLHPLGLIFISLRTGSPLPSTITPTTTPMIFLLIKWLISTPANLMPTPLTNPTTSPTTMSSTHPPTSSHPSPVRRSTFRIRLLRRLLLCSPALARPLKGATGRAMRPKTSDALNGLSTDSSRGGEGSGVGKGESTSLGGVGFARGVTMARIIDQIEYENRKNQNRHLARRAIKGTCTSRRKRARGKIHGV